MRDRASVVTLTNAERDRAGVATLQVSDKLTLAAQLHADQMARLGKLAHRLSRGLVPRPEDRLAAVGYAWRAVAENIAFNQPHAAAVVASWLKTPAHRANILSPSLTETGVGSAPDALGRLYWVQMFGRPTKS